MTRRRLAMAVLFVTTASGCSAQPQPESEQTSETAQDSAAQETRAKPKMAPDEAESSITHGIDVSHHQRAIDWAALPSQSVSFAYIKASEGGDWRDKRFATNWREARAAGIERGAYHYFTLCRSGAEQAANFIAAVPESPDALPPAVDLEYLGNCDRRPSREAFQAELTDYLDAVETHFGQPVLLYTTQQFERDYALSEDFDNPLWLRSMEGEPDFTDRPWTIWQQSSSKRLRGIAGPVDWNAKRGD